MDNLSITSDLVASFQDCNELSFHNFVLSRPGTISICGGNADLSNVLILELRESQALRRNFLPIYGCRWDQPTARQTRIQRRAPSL